MTISETISRAAMLYGFVKSVVEKNKEIKHKKNRMTVEQMVQFLQENCSEYEITLELVQEVYDDVTIRIPRIHTLYNEIINEYDPFTSKEITLHPTKTFDYEKAKELVCLFEEVNYRMKIPHDRVFQDFNMDCTKYYIIKDLYLNNKKETEKVICTCYRTLAAMHYTKDYIIQMIHTNPYFRDLSDDEIIRLLQKGEIL